MTEPLFLAAAGTVLVVDRATKTLVERLLPLGVTVPATRWAPVRLRRVRNPRLAGVRGVVVGLWLVTVTATVLLAQIPFDGDEVAQLGLGAALGGATGNAVDRVVHRGVVDFIDVRAWPVFNLADVGITGGTVLTLLRMG